MDYKKEINDIYYIYKSGVIDVLDLQYILKLIYELLNASKNIDDIKDVLNKIDLKYKKETENINELDCYFYLLSLIKNDLNLINNITNDTKNKIIVVLNNINNNMGIGTNNNSTFKIEIPLENYLNSSYLRDFIIDKKQMPYECSICGLNRWQNNYLRLELDYIDGNKNNQESKNLRLLCPNCFSQVGYQQLWN